MVVIVGFVVNVGGLISVVVDVSVVVVCVMWVGVLVVVLFGLLLGVGDVCMLSFFLS